MKTLSEKLVAHRATEMGGVFPQYLIDNAKALEGQVAYLAIRDAELQAGMNQLCDTIGDLEAENADLKTRIAEAAKMCRVYQKLTHECETTATDILEILEGEQT